MPKINNPKEISRSFKKRQNGPASTFAISAELYAPGEEEAPQMMYDGSFSLFRPVILKDGTSVRSSINIDEIPALLEKSRYFFNKYMDVQYEKSFETIKASSEAGDSPAYTVKLTAGQYKGRTPAEILMADPSATKALNEHYKWLKENLPKYKNNQRVMDAIVEAAKLFEEGKLSAETVTKTVNHGSIVLYKPVTKPLVRKTNDKGACFTYELSIIGYLDDDYPVEVTIRNYYAPVITKEDGTINVVASQKTDEKKFSFRLSFEEWCYHIDRIRSIKSVYEAGTGPALMKRADQIDRQNREEAKRN